MVSQIINVFLVTDGEGVVHVSSTYHLAVTTNTRQSDEVH